MYDSIVFDSFIIFFPQISMNVQTGQCVLLVYVSTCQGTTTVAPVLMASWDREASV